MATKDDLRKIQSLNSSKSDTSSKNNSLSDIKPLKPQMVNEGSGLEYFSKQTNKDK